LKIPAGQHRPAWDTRALNALTAFPNPTIRVATSADAEGVAQLSGQLGYPSTAEEAVERLRAVKRYSEHAVYVAEANGRLVGWIHVFARPSLTTEPSAEVAGLVVDEHCRGCGIGQALMSEAERWAKEEGCRSVRLRSNVSRLRAHAFYERLGYEAIKTSKSFCKFLD
jgi:predicted N-acetyltransferase YhbS